MKEGAEGKVHGVLGDWGVARAAAVMNGTDGVESGGSNMSPSLVRLPYTAPEALFGIKTSTFTLARAIVCLWGSWGRCVDGPMYHAGVRKKVLVCAHLACAYCGVVLCCGVLLICWSHSMVMCVGRKEADIWCLGCVLAECIMGAPLFTGTREMDIMCSMSRVIGPPDASLWPAFAAKYPGMPQQAGAHDDDAVTPDKARQVLTERLLTLFVANNHHFADVVTSAPLEARALCGTVAACLAHNPAHRPTAIALLVKPSCTPFFVHYT